MAGLDCLEEHFETVLIDLIKKGKCNEVLSLVKDLPIEDLYIKGGSHLLHVAAQYNNIELIQHLPVRTKFKLYVKNIHGHTPIISAIIYENYEIAKYLYSTQFELNLATDSDDDDDDAGNCYVVSVLRYGLKKANLSPAKIGVALAKVTDWQLSDVVRFHNSLTTEYFIQTANEMDIPVNFDGVVKIIVDKHDWPHLEVILRYACTRVDAIWLCSMWAYIMAKICDMHKSKTGRNFLKGIFRSPIFGRAGILQSLEVTLMSLEMKQLKVFLDYNLASSIKDNQGRYILASIFGNSSVNVKLLLREDQIDVNGRGYNSKTPLHFATENGLIENVMFLLDRGADPNALDNNGSTPLALSLLRPISEICVKMLLFAGGNPLLISGDEDLTKEHFYSANFTNVHSYVVAQILIYEALGRSIDKTDNLFASWSKSIADKFIKSGRKQLKKLKTQRILNTQMTMFTVLVEKPKKVARYACKEDVQAILEFTNSNENVLFSYYYELLQKNAQDIILMQSCRERAIKIVCRFIDIPDPHHLVVNKIVDYFNAQDFKKFEEAENSPSSLSLVNKGMRLLKLTKEFIPHYLSSNKTNVAHRKTE